MCLLVLLHRVVPDRPVVLGANRDERYDRGGEPPVRRGGVLAPRDPRAGGTWVGRSDAGLVVAVVNRRDAAPPPAAPRSRGLLADDLLRLPDVAAVEAALAAADLSSYSPCGFIVADASGALHARWNGRDVRIDRLAPGVHAVSNRLEPPDFDPAAILRVLGPADGGLDALLDRLAALLRRHDAGPFSGVVPCLHGPDLGTTSSCLIATGEAPVFRFAAGPPCRTAYADFGP